MSQVYLPLNFVLPVLVGASMFITTKMTSTVAMDERQQSQQRIMQWMMPVMIGVFTYQFPAGLGIYILLSNIVGVVIQYFVGGQQPIDLFGKLYLGTPETRSQAIAAKAEAREQANSQMTRKRRRQPMTNRRVFTGKNVQEATAVALETLGAELEDVDIRVINPGRSGIFGLGGALAEIEVAKLSDILVEEENEAAERQRQMDQATGVAQANESRPSRQNQATEVQ